MMVALVQQVLAQDQVAVVAQEVQDQMHQVILQVQVV
jgi:hypothetical protein